MSARHREEPGSASTSAIRLTSGILPHESILAIIRRANVPVIVVQDGMYRAASRISDLVAKMTSSEEEKVERAYELVTEHLDLAALRERLGC